MATWPGNLLSALGLSTPVQLAKGGKDERGFTLAELLVVITILGIVAVVGILQFTTARANQELDRAAQELAADIRWMQQLSAYDDTPRLSAESATNTKLSYRYILGLNTKENKYEVRDETVQKILKTRQFSDHRVKAAVLVPEGKDSVDITFYASDLDRLSDPSNADSLENAAYQIRLTHDLTGATRNVNVAARVSRVWISK